MNCVRILSRWKQQIVIGARYYCEHTGELKRTALYDFHVSHGGRMVPFAGWSMPLQYEELSIINSTHHTRKAASLFDVSHMLQLQVTGKDSLKFLELVSVADLQALENGAATLSVLTSPSGGILDDCIITKDGPNSFFVVSNAGRADHDWSHLTSLLKQSSLNATISRLSERSLLALQGPQMASILQQGVKGDLSKLAFMHSAIMDVFGIHGCRVSRCGYTGEDGVEVSVPSERAIELASKLLSVQPAKLAGLGARDILRLEAGLCLYGSDITEETTPVEAGLTWCISKRRASEGGFIGCETIQQQLKEKPTVRRIGIRSEGPPARHGAEVLSSNGNVIGVVTSGGPSPILGYNIAMAYLPIEASKVGTILQLRVRRNVLQAEVVKMPFVPTKYYKPAK
eukprot:Em0001g1103a